MGGGASFIAALMIQSKIADCPDCGVPVVACDNSVRLDPTPTPDGMWSVMQLGNQVWACSADTSGVGSRFDMHEHQPPEFA